MRSISGKNTRRRIDICQGFVLIYIALSHSISPGIRDNADLNSRSWLFSAKCSLLKFKVYSRIYCYVRPSILLGRGAAPERHCMPLDSCHISPQCPSSRHSRSTSHLLSRHDTPSPDQIIRIPRKQRLPIRAPRQTHTLGFPALLADLRIFRFQFIDLALLLQIKDDYGAGSGGT